MKKNNWEGQVLAVVEGQVQFNDIDTLLRRGAAGVVRVRNGPLPIWVIGDYPGPVHLPAYGGAIGWERDVHDIREQLTKAVFASGGVGENSYAHGCLRRLEEYIQKLETTIKQE